MQNANRKNSSIVIASSLSYPLTKNTTAVVMTSSNYNANNNTNNDKNNRCRYAGVKVPSAMKTWTHHPTTLLFSTVTTVTAPTSASKLASTSASASKLASTSALATTSATTHKLNSNTIVQNLELTPIGSLTNEQITQACHLLSNMTTNNNYNNNDDGNNSTNSSSSKAWKIIQRLLLEYRTTTTSSSTTTTTIINENMDYKICHNAIQCMINSHHHDNDNNNNNNNKTKNIDSMIQNANELLQQLEQYYIDTKSNTIHPIGKSYILLLESIPFMIIKEGGGINGDDNSNDENNGNDENIENDENNGNDENNENKKIDFIQQIMERIKVQEQNGNPQVRMNPQLVNAILNALATLIQQQNQNAPSVSLAVSSSSSSPLYYNSPNRALQLVLQIMNNDQSKIDSVSYGIAIKAISSCYNWTDVIHDQKQQYQYDNDSDNGTACSTDNTIIVSKLIENMLLQMQQKGIAGSPHVKLMTPILHSLSKEGNINEMYDLIEWMEQMYHDHGWNDVRPNNYHLNTLITALSRRTYNNRNCKGAGHLAMDILQKMKTLYETGGNKNLRPDLITYNAVLHCISKEENVLGTKKVSNDIGNRAEALLTRMEDGEEGNDIRPDIFSYNAVLSAYMNSGNSDAASKSQKMLLRMSSKDIEPDLLSYTICINALSKSKITGSAHKAEDLLRVLESAYDGGCEALKPDVKCYNSGE